MVSTKFLGHINRNCAKFLNCRLQVMRFLVVSLLFFVDFSQFPPVRGDPLRKSKPADTIPDLERDGLNVWRSFGHKIILTEGLRQKKDTVYQKILERARNVSLAQEDVKLLNSYTIPCRKSRGDLLSELSITTKNRLRHKLNFLHVVDYAKSRNQKFYIF
jgi:hypothetical protein